MRSVAAEKKHVALAIKESRLTVDLENGTAWIKREDPKAVWRQARFDLVAVRRPGDGYARIRFTCSAGRFRCLLHRVVWFASGVDIPKGKMLNHKDGDKQNNALVNLELVSAKGNYAHAVVNGLRKPGYFLGRMRKGSRLDEADVRDVRQRIKDGERQKDIAKRYSVSQAAIADINIGRSYHWVQRSPRW